MKKIIIVLLLMPVLGIAQLNYKDLTFLVHNKIDKNIEYIQKKGYNYRQERITADGTKQVYYERGKQSNTMIVMRIGKSGYTAISYVPEDKNNFDDIHRELKKPSFRLTNSTSNEKEKCYFYESKEYISKACEVKFPESTTTSYHISFYRNGFDINK